ncbi:hypothetical protein WJX72_002051 [[Myrmecia] bisecta]|uniref:AB hydrolase-1 domain-containing protein n=1 Tax=[Myrmecia] bisecta TaxID=41462 RepID=A0AAW1QEB8_9CHLO
MQSGTGSLSQHSSPAQINRRAKTLLPSQAPPSRRCVRTGIALRPDPAPARIAPPPIVDPNLPTVSGDSKKINLADITRNDGGPPRFVSPYVASRKRGLDPANLPLMVYLPGIDGTGLAASRQFPYLVNAFDLRALSVPTHDRSTFQELVQIVEQYLEVELQGCPPQRPVYLLGESFGAVLSVAVAAVRPDLVDRVVLVNPATSFQRSPWPLLGPLLPQMPDDLYHALPILLSPVLGNPISMAAIGVDWSAPLPNQLSAFAEGVKNLLPQLDALKYILPPATLAHKLALLEQGNADVAEKFRRVQQRVLLITGDRDLLIPSHDEGPRLKKLFPRCTLKVLKGRSHALLQEGGVNLVELMQEAGFYVQRRVLSAPLERRGKASFGSAAPIELPTPRELDTYAEGLSAPPLQQCGKASLGLAAPTELPNLHELDRYAEGTTRFLRQLVSPVFFSTHADGRIEQGLGAIPPDRPILFVGNHQTYALDTGFMVEEMIRERGMMLRGLAHPVVFGGMQLPEEQGQGAFSNLMTTFGAVPVGGRNFFRLLQQGEAVMLFPGGVREAYKGKGEAYQLFWPARAEFVRMAARFGATIVPFAGVGAEDCFEMVAGPQEIRNAPIIGPLIEQRIRDAFPAARRGVSQAEGLEDLFIQPLSIPKLPSRFYFAFRKPIQTLPDMDRSQADEVYRQIRSEVEGGISWLLRERERDPYKDLLPRLLYEASWGNARQAPTFALPRQPVVIQQQGSQAREGHRSTGHSQNGHSGNGRQPRSAADAGGHVHGEVSSTGGPAVERSTAQHSTAQPGRLSSTGGPAIGEVLA